MLPAGKKGSHVSLTSRFKTAKKRGRTHARLHMFSQRDAKESTYARPSYFIAHQRVRWLKESKHHFAWRNNICRRRMTWEGLWGNMFVLSLGRKACDEMKTIKSEFGGPVCQLISPWQSSQEATQEERWDWREKPLRSLSNSIPPSQPSASSSPCQKPLPPSGSRRRRESFPRCLLHRCCLVIGWGLPLAVNRLP